jgi:putative transposase
MSLPKNVIAYIKGLMRVFENANCVSLAKAISGSHDSLSRILNNEKFSWQTLLENFILRIFGKLSDGWLIIDDTIISKTFARKIENLAWVFDSKIGKSIVGLNFIALVWANGRITLPIGIKIYRPKSGKTKMDLAVELLKLAKRLKIRPRYVAFDSWYASGGFMRTIRENKWHFVTRLKPNRIFNGIPLREIARNPYWMMAGKLSGGQKVIVVRNGKKYFAASNMKLSKPELLARYKSRWEIETVFRMLHSKLGIDQCESRKLRAQEAHFHLCLMAYAVFKNEQYLTGKSIYQIKRECSFDFKTADNILSKLNFQSA